jgi:hypothetical protein
MSRHISKRVSSTLDIRSLVKKNLHHYLGFHISGVVPRKAILHKTKRLNARKNHHTEPSHLKRPTFMRTSQINHLSHALNYRKLGLSNSAHYLFFFSKRSLNRRVHFGTLRDGGYRFTNSSKDEINSHKDVILLPPSCSHLSPQNVSPSPLATFVLDKLHGLKQFNSQPSNYYSFPGKNDYLDEDMIPSDFDEVITPTQLILSRRADEVSPTQLANKDQPLSQQDVTDLLSLTEEQLIDQEWAKEDPIWTLSLTEVKKGITIDHVVAHYGKIPDLLTQHIVLTSDKGFLVGFGSETSYEIAKKLALPWATIFSPLEYDPLKTNGVFYRVVYSCASAENLTKIRVCDAIWNDFNIGATSVTINKEKRCVSVYYKNAAQWLWMAKQQLILVPALAPKYEEVFLRTIVSFTLTSDPTYTRIFFGGFPNNTHEKRIRGFLKIFKVEPELIALQRDPISNKTHNYGFITTGTSKVVTQLLGENRERSETKCRGKTVIFRLAEMKRRKDI